MDKRVSFVTQDGRKLNSVVMSFGETVFFFKQTGPVDAEEQAIISMFMKTTEVTKSFPIHPDAFFVEVSNPITNEVLGSYELSSVNEVNYKTRNIKFYRPSSVVNLSKPGIEPFDMKLKPGTNLAIQETLDESVD